jgi:toxoflavin biosynthesis protein ToxD
MFRSWITKEMPQHPVRLDAYLISQFPITNGQYRPFLDTCCAPMPESLVMGEPDDHPVWGVSYGDARRYADFVSMHTRSRFRLPTEPEWEYAARGPRGYTYPFGQVFSSEKCNTLEAGIGHTTSVSQYAEYASGFGICDMAGNVEEWTSTDYHPYPNGSFVADDLACGSRDGYKILRGGSFARSGDLARCARRHGPHPDPVFRYRGFRLVQEIQ